MNTDYLKEEMAARDCWLQWFKDHGYRYPGENRSTFASCLRKVEPQNYIVERNQIEKRNILKKNKTYFNEGDIFQLNDVRPGYNLYIDITEPITTEGTLKKLYFTYVEVFRKDNEGILRSEGIQRFYLSALIAELYAFKKDEYGCFKRCKESDAKADGSVITMFNRFKEFNLAISNISQKLIKVTKQKMVNIRIKGDTALEDHLRTECAYTLDFL